jgi:hypothetical protein
MSDVFDKAIDRQSPPNDPARVAALSRVRRTLRILRDQRVRGAAAAARPKDRQRRADVIESGWQTCWALTRCCFRNSANRLSKYGDKTLTLFADGTPVEILVFRRAARGAVVSMELAARWVDFPRYWRK